MCSLCLVPFAAAPALSLVLYGYRTPTTSEAVLLILLGRSKDFVISGSVSTKHRSLVKIPT